MINILDETILISLFICKTDLVCETIDLNSEATLKKYFKTPVIDIETKSAVNDNLIASLLGYYLKYEEMYFKYGGFNFKALPILGSILSKTKLYLPRMNINVVDYKLNKHITKCFQSWSFKYEIYNNSKLKLDKHRDTIYIGFNGVDEVYDFYKFSINIDEAVVSINEFNLTFVLLSYNTHYCYLLRRLKLNYPNMNLKVVTDVEYYKDIDKYENCYSQYAIKGCKRLPERDSNNNYNLIESNYY